MDKNRNILKLEFIFLALSSLSILMSFCTKKVQILYFWKKLRVILTFRNYIMERMINIETKIGNSAAYKDFIIISLRKYIKFNLNFEHFSYFNATWNRDTFS